MSTHRLIRAFFREPVDKTPVWLMRQAGRYLPEYRALRKKAGGFMSLCKTPDLASEITLQPLRRFDLDGAIIFSDILTIPDAMGLGLYFVENEGPKFKKYISHEKDILALPIPDPNIELRYVMDAIRLTKKSLSVPLIGFAGSPWTIATYMLSGLENAKKILYQSPALLHNLLNKLTDSIILYLNAQIEAGVEAVMIFDTWGGMLTTRDYRAFSLFYAQKIISGLNLGNKKIPCIFFTKFGGQWLEEILSTGCDVVGLDWTVDIRLAREKIGDKVALQGNLDPSLLYTNPDRIREEVAYILNAYGSYPGHIFNLGHGVPQDVPIQNVEALINAVHDVC